MFGHFDIFVSLYIFKIAKTAYINDGKRKILFIRKLHYFKDTSYNNSTSLRANYSKLS